MSALPFPLSQYCASNLPPLHYTGFAARPPQPSVRSSSCHLKRNASIPSVLKHVVRIPTDDFIRRIRSYTSTLPNVDMNHAHLLPPPQDQARLVLQIRVPLAKEPTRNLPVIKSHFQVSAPADVGDAVRLSILPTVSYLFRSVYSNRPGDLGIMARYRWKTMLPYCHDPRLRADGVYNAPSLQGYTWAARDIPKPVDIKGKGKETAASGTSDQLFLATSARWVMTTQDFADLTNPRRLNSPTEFGPFGNSKNVVADHFLARITDHCLHHRIHRVIITTHDLWSFGTFSTDWSELHLTEPIPYTSAPPEHAPHRHPSTPLDHLGCAGYHDAPFSILQALLFMMESVSSTTSLADSSFISEPQSQNDPVSPNSTVDVNIASGSSTSETAALPTPLASQTTKRKRGLKELSISGEDKASFQTTATYAGSESSGEASKKRRVAPPRKAKRTAQPLQELPTIPSYAPPSPAPSPSPTAPSFSPPSTFLQPPRRSESGQPPEITQTVHRVATVGMFLGLGPVGREKCMRIAQALRLARKNGAGDADVDRDVDGSGRAALTVARAR